VVPSVNVMTQGLPAVHCSPGHCGKTPLAQMTLPLYKTTAIICPLSCTRDPKNQYKPQQHRQRLLLLLPPLLLRSARLGSPSREGPSGRSKPWRNRSSGVVGNLSTYLL